MTDKFYNMQIGLIKNGSIHVEKAAIRNVWEKNGSIFFDIFLHRLNKALIFEASFVHDIYDVSQDKAYTSIEQFIEDFNQSKLLPKKEAKIPQAKARENLGILDPLKDDISMMLFMARCSYRITPLKERIIFDYIKSQIESAKNLSEPYLRHFISGLSSTEDDFYNGLKKMKSKTPKEAIRFLREMIKICLSDGHLHYIERTYLSDIFQMLRNAGVSLPTDLI